LSVVKMLSVVLLSPIAVASGRPQSPVYVFIVCGADAVCGAPLPYRCRLGSAPAAS
jgi:hypothetical protein